MSKVYEVVLDVAATDAQLSQLEEGVTILLKNREEHFCRALAERVDSEAEGCVERRADNEAVSKEDGSDNPDKIRLTISEGKASPGKEDAGRCGAGCDVAKARKNRCAGFGRLSCSGRGKRVYAGRMCTCDGSGLRS